MIYIVYSTVGASCTGTHIYSVPDGKGGRKEVEGIGMTEAPSSFKFPNMEVRYQGEADTIKWVRRGSESHSIEIAEFEPPAPSMHL